MFWACIVHRKKAGKFSFQKFAAELGVNKSLVSRWFNGDPNWSVNTIAAIANILNLELEIRAKDRNTGIVYTPTGIDDDEGPNAASVSVSQSEIERPAGVFIAVANGPANPSGWTTIDRNEVRKLKRFGEYVNPSPEVIDNIKRVMAA